MEWDARRSFLSRMAVSVVGWTAIVAAMVVGGMSTPAAAQPAPVVAEATSHTVRAVFEENGPFRVQFPIDVPANAATVTVATVGTDLDVDLYVSHQRPIQNPKSAPIRSVNPGGGETIFLSAHTTPPLRSGTYFVVVENADQLPGTCLVQVQIVMISAVTSDPPPRREPPTVPAAPAVRSVELNQPVEWVFPDPRHGEFAQFRFEFPPDLDAVRIEVSEAEHDIDLYVRIGEPMESLDDADRVAASLEHNETLTLRREESRGLPVFVAVRSFAGGPARAMVTVVADPSRWLVAGETTWFELPAQQVLGAVFALDVPSGAGFVRVEFDADGPVELAVRLGGLDGTDYTGEGIAERAGVVFRVPTMTAQPTWFFVLSTTADRSISGRLRVSVEAPAREPEPTVREISAGEFVAVELDSTVRRALFAVEVPATAETMQIQLTSDSPHDVDMFARFADALTDAGEARFSSTNMDSNELLFFSRDDATAKLETGHWYVLLVYLDPTEPVSATLRVEFDRLAPGAFSTDTIGELDPHALNSVEVPAGQPGISQFVVDVPAEAKLVYIYAVTETPNTDLDVFVRPAEPMTHLRQASFSATSNSSAELIVLDGADLSPGRLFIVLATYGRACTATVEIGIDRAVPIIPPVDGELVADLPVALDFSRDSRVIYTFVVPELAENLLLQIENAQTDVDMYLRRHLPISLYRPTHVADSMEFNETLFLDRDGGLRPGLYYVGIHQLEPGPPGVTVRLRFDVQAPDQGGTETLPAPRGMRAVVAGQPVEMVFEPMQARQDFFVDVPAGTTNLQITLTGGDPDIDLYVRALTPMESTSQATYKSDGTTSSERIFVGTDQLQAGRYFIAVVNYDGRATEARLLVEFDVSEATETAEPTQPFDGELRPGEPVTMRFPRRDRRPAFTYYFRVPDGTTAVELRIGNATADLDLYVSRGRHVRSWDDDGADYSATSPQANEVMYLSATSRPPLRPGLYYVDVHNYENTAQRPTLTLTFDGEMPPDVTGAVPVVPIPLGLDEPMTTGFDRQRQQYMTFTVEVPAGAQRLTVATHGATADLDLYAKFGSPIRDWNDERDYDAIAYSGRLDEVLTLRGTRRRPLRPGTYYIDVVCFPKDLDVEFTIVAVIDKAPELPALELPPYAAMADLTPLQRAVHACVAVDADEGSGSGTVVSPAGFVITNMHVIGDDETGEYQRDNIYISFTYNDRHAPRQTHVARTVAVSPENDLVLLKIYRTVRGERIDDATANFIWIPWAGADSLALGDTVRVLGFPDVGGERTRNSVTLTRGIISGFETRKDATFWIKTDSPISSGNSGGTMIDDHGRLVGIPTMIIHIDAGVLAYARPACKIPAEWWAIIATTTNNGANAPNNGTDNGTDNGADGDNDGADD